MIHLNDEQMIPLQDGELDAVSGGTAVEYAVMLALIIVACTDKLTMNAPTGVHFAPHANASTAKY